MFGAWTGNVAPQMSRLERLTTSVARLCRVALVPQEFHNIWPSRITLDMRYGMNLHGDCRRGVTTEQSCVVERQHRSMNLHKSVHFNGHKRGDFPNLTALVKIERSTNHIAGNSTQVSSFYHQHQPPPCTLIARRMHTTLTTWQGYTWNSDAGGPTDKMSVQSLIFGETHRRPCRLDYHDSVCSGVTR